MSRAGRRFGRGGVSRRASGRRSYRLALAGVALLASAAGVVIHEADLLVRPELSTIDSRFSIRGDVKPDPDIALVGIDAATFQKIARFPFSRAEHARVVRALARDGAKVIAYDVQFTEASDDPDADNALFDAFGTAPGRTVLSTTEVDDKGHTNVLGGDENLKEIGAVAASTLLKASGDGKIRLLDYEVEKLRTFAVRAAEIADHRTVDPASFSKEGAAIDYVGGPGSYPYTSFWRVAEGRFRPGTFRGKIVIVGAAAPSLQDVRYTPTSGSQTMDGIEINANAIQTVRHGLPLRDASDLADLIAILLLALAVPLAGVRLTGVRSLLAGLALGAGYLVVAQVAFDRGRILPVVSPLIALTVAAVGTLSVHYLLSAFERQRVRDLFSRFVPASVVDQVVAAADQDLRLGGERREATVMFTDLRGFTSFGETREPSEVIDVLNRYLGEMSGAILDHGGTLVAYMGDGIMAVFGAPIDQPDHADRALAAAREMLDERLPRFNDWMMGEGIRDEAFKMGIGLNTGAVMSGNVGSERRLEYTAIGDTTNTAARLEGMTKGTPHQLFLSDATRAKLVSDPGDLILVGDLEVRGRENTIRVWSLSAPGDGAAAAPAADAAPA